MTDIIPGMTFGAWTLIGAEGRRAWARCQCGTVRQMALEALQDGSSLSCGCINTPSTRSGLRHVTFANEIAGAEARGGKRRHQGGGWIK
jgi:hypothetical protein